MADYTVNGAAICAYDTIGCGTYVSGNYYVTGVSVNAYDPIACPFTLGASPDANITQWENTDLVFTVYTTKGELTLDNVIVDFVIKSGSGTTITTKSTSDYSVITFGNTLVVHLNENELPANKTLHYTATITTSGELEYSMTGLIHASGTAVDTCFTTKISVPERLISVIPTSQRGELKMVTERTTSKILCVRPSKVIKNATRTSDVIESTRVSDVIPCENTPILITNSERTPGTIVIAPCGKRRG